MKTPLRMDLFAFDGRRIAILRRQILVVNGLVVDALRNVHSDLAERRVAAGFEHLKAAAHVLVETIEMKTAKHVSWTDDTFISDVAM